jgi:hypothetical protein
MIDLPYQSSVQAIGGSGLYELSATGDLPPGLSMETGGSTVAFGGVPTTTGTYAFQITIRDADGTSFKQDFSIQVNPRVPGPLAQRQGAVTDSEGITVTDVEAVFLPAQVIDNESITLTDTETDLDSVVVVVNEGMTLHDTESELDSVVVVDNEVTTLSDSVSGLDADEVAVNETVTTTDTITVAILTVPRIYWTAPAPIAYGTPLSATQLNATGSVDGTLTYTPPIGTVLPAGQQTLAVTLTPNNTTEYAPATDTVTLTVNQAAQSISFTPPTSPVTYPVSPITLSATGGASGNPVTFSVVSGPGTASGANGSTLAITNVGTVVVAANQAGNTNYSAAPQVTQSIVVNSPAAILLSPTPGLSTKLGASNVSFTWTTAAGATDYELTLGTALGATNLYVYKGTAISTIVSTLPANGETVYATLYSKINGIWLSNAYLYTESGTPVPATLTSPTPGVTTVLGTANVSFQWSAGTGVTNYQLNLSAVTPGASDLFLYKGTATSASVAALPANGAIVYATLYSYINGAWQSNAYEYIESGTATLAVLTSPTPGASTILGAGNVTFQWTAGNAATDYQLNLSAIAPGGSDLFVYKGTALTTIVPTLPANGVVVYARLYSKINGVWQSNDYVYTESGTPAPAVLTSPTPGIGTVLGVSNVQFQWTAGIGVSDYQLNLSAVAPGESELFLYKGTAATATATTLPANGAEVYARLYSKINGVWQYNDYVYTEQ